jgi:hypothetical protein
MLTSSFFDRKWKKEGRYDTEMEELDAFSNALAIQNTTLLYHQMADRLYR